MRSPCALSSTSRLVVRYNRYAALSTRSLVDSTIWPGMPSAVPFSARHLEATSLTTIRTSAPLLPQQVNELLLELALALQRYAMYPGGHPSLDVAVARVTARLEAYLAHHPHLSLGVARRQLVVEGVATDSTHPVLRVLAERLHSHRLGAVVFRAGLSAGELSEAMRALAEDPDRTGDPLGGALSTRIARWPHVQLYRVTYEQLQLTQDDGEEGADSDVTATTAQLWLGLARGGIAAYGECGCGHGSGCGSARNQRASCCACVRPDDRRVSAGAGGAAAERSECARSGARASSSVASHAHTGSGDAGAAARDGRQLATASAFPA